MDGYCWPDAIALRNSKVHHHQLKNDLSVYTSLRHRLHSIDFELVPMGVFPIELSRCYELDKCLVKICTAVAQYKKAACKIYRPLAGEKILLGFLLRSLRAL